MFSTLLKVALMTLAICNCYATGITSKRQHEKRQQHESPGPNATQESPTQG
jgi:hypothetical protein